MALSLSPSPFFLSDAKLHWQKESMNHARTGWSKLGGALAPKPGQDYFAVTVPRTCDLAVENPSGEALCAVQRKEKSLKIVLND